MSSTRCFAARGGRLRCDRAKADPQVSECRGTVTDSELGGPINLWVSAIDSAAGVITLSARGGQQRRSTRWRRRSSSATDGSRRKVQGGNG